MAFDPHPSAFSCHLTETASPTRAEMAFDPQPVGVRLPSRSLPGAPGFGLLVVGFGYA
jgi:hypothetical protein